MTALQGETFARDLTTIEVKSVLTKSRLRSSLSAIRKLRAVGSERHYVVPAIGTKNGTLVLTSQKRVLTVPPRSYVVAFAQTGLGKTYEEFKDDLRGLLDEQNDHVHGVCVLDRNWFAGRIAFRSPAQLFGRDGHALLDLYSSILKGQQNYSVYSTDLDAYLKEPKLDV